MQTIFIGTPEGSLIGHGPFTRSADPPENTTAFYRQDYSLSEKKPWWTPSEITREFPAPPDDLSLSLTWEDPSPDPFANVFREIMDSIRSGTLEKCVPVVTQNATILNGSPPNLIHHLTHTPSNLTPYGWWDEKSGVLGATPETLFTLDQGLLHTMALAGTARREEREVFCVDEKEIREHEFVAQTLLAKLSDLGMTRRHDRHMLDLGPLVHFQTNIEVELYRQEKINDLISRLHPTPALGPLPRTSDTMKLAINWRDRLQCPPTFGAPFGLQHEGKFHAIVTIRMISWNEQNLTLPSGCGIIQESRLVNEWRELQLKRQAVKNTFHLQ